MTASLAISFFTAPASSDTTRSISMDYDESSLPAEVIRAAQAGDEGAFNCIMRATKGRLLGMASRYVQSALELDELGQEIFVQVWKGMKSFRFDAPFPNWLSKVAVNTCLNHIKRRRRRWSLFVSPEEPELLENTPDRTPDLESSARDAVERLRPALEALKPEERLIVTLLHIEERSVAEIAELTGWSQSNVKVRALRARAKLKELLLRYEQA